MASVLFTHSYHLRLDPKQWRAAKPYPPLGTLYAAAAVRAGGHDVSLHDSMLEPDERTFSVTLERVRPEVVVVLDDGFNYLTKMCLGRMRSAALEMTRAAARSGARVVVGGSDASDHPQAFFAAGAIAVLSGEVEQTLVAAVPRLARGDEVGLRDIPGLHLLHHSTPERTLVRDLDGLAAPAWDLVDLARYRGVWERAHGRFSLNVSTTRGCPYACNWCAKPIYGSRYTVRSPESVAEEWASLVRSFRPDHLWVTDDIFGLKPGWVERLRVALAERGVRIPYSIQARVDLMTPDVVAALAASGCEEVWVGAESGAQSVLDAMEKGTTVPQIEAAALRLRAAGIRVAFFLQFGYPGEGPAEIEATLSLVRRALPDDIGISVSYPLPGTRFFDSVSSQLGEKRNWRDSDDLDPMYPSLYPRAFYRALHHRVHAELRWRRALVGLRREGAVRAIRGVRYGLALPFLVLRTRMLQRARPAAVVTPPTPLRTRGVSWTSP